MLLSYIVPEIPPKEENPLHNKRTTPVRCSSFTIKMYQIV